MLKLLILAASVIFALFVLLYFFQNKLIFFPQKLPDTYETPLLYQNCKLEEVFLNSESGNRIHGVFALPVDGKELLDTSDFVLLYSHGNAGNLTHRLARMSALAGIGLSQFIYDYSGFGKSTGKATVENAVLDGKAALKYLLEEKEIPANRIILYGESLGTGIAAILARDFDGPFASLVLESGFRSLRHQAKRGFGLPGAMVLRNNLPTDEIIAGYDGSLLVIHSKSDEIIPWEDSKYLYDLKKDNKAKFFMENAGHNDPVWLSKDYIAQWTNHMVQLEGKAQPINGLPPFVAEQQLKK